MISRDITNSATFQNDLVFFLPDSSLKTLQFRSLLPHSHTMNLHKVSVPFYQRPSKGSQAEASENENQIRYVDEPMHPEILHFGLYR